MFTWIVRWLTGYVTFSVTGKDAQRFASAAASRGYVLWNIRQETPERITACIALSRYPELHVVAKKRRLRVRILERHGVPFLLRCWKRERKQGLLIGALGAAVLLCVFSTRVWVIEVSGAETLSPEAVRAAAAELGLKVGTGKASYTSERIEDGLLLRFPEISWVSVNDWGSKVEIVLREGVSAPKVESQEEYGNVTAKTGGQILRMDVYHGKTRAKKGDGVIPGQLLVSGVVESTDGDVRFVKAQAKIMAQTRRTFRAEVPAKKTVWEKTGKEIERKSLSVFGITLPLNFWGTPKGAYEKETVSGALTVHHVDLPLFFNREIYREQTGRTESVSEEEAKKKGLRMIRKLQNETLEDPLEKGTILSEDVSISRRKDSYVVESRCVCVENIAREVPFYVELEQNDENLSSKSEKD